MSADAPFNIKKPVFGYIVNELQARKDPVAASSMKPWIRATSNLSSGKSLSPTKYKNIIGGYDAMYSIRDQNRPNPIITGWSIDFSSRGTLRKGTLKIKCFSIKQLEEIQKFFMEPAVSVFVEWGWNKSASTGKKIVPQDLDPTALAQLYNNELTLLNKRQQEIGCYDNMLGIITKANSDVSGTDFTVSCTITSVGELLMGLSRRGQEIPKDTVDEDQDKYDLGEFVNDTNNEIRPWAYFFNSLKPQFQSKALKDWGQKGGDATYGKIDPLRDFINYDDLWVQDVKDETTKTNAVSSFFGVDNQFKFLEKEWTPYSEQSPILDKKYIKFSAFVAIFNKICEIRGLSDGAVMTPFIKIGTRDRGVQISAFKSIFSPDTRIYIPNQYAINWHEGNPWYKAAQGAGVGPVVDNRVKGGVSFPNPSTSVTTLNGTTIQVNAYSTGWIGDVYIANDLADQMLSDSDGDMKDLLDTLLGEMADASQGLWNFQIVPSTINNLLTLEIVESRLNDKTQIQPTQFYFTGPNSVFLEASYNLDLPKAMANKIAMARTNSSLYDVDSSSRVFSDGEKDFVMQNILAKKAKSVAQNTPKPETPSDDEHKQMLWEAFCRYSGIILDPTISELGGTWLKTVGRDISDYLMPGVSTNVEVFNSQRVSSAQKGAPAGVQPLPLKINFTVLGISGFKFGDVISIIGLPRPFNDISKGHFMIVEVTHKVDDKLWTTEVEAQYRPKG